MTDAGAVDRMLCPACERPGGSFLPGISKRSGLRWFLCSCCLTLWSRGSTQDKTGGS